jgi:hypothetical protein
MIKSFSHTGLEDFFYDGTKKVLIRNMLINLEEFWINCIVPF